MLRPTAGGTWGGTLHCTSLTPSLGRCLARSGHLAIAFNDDGTFLATVNLGATCTAHGTGSVGAALRGTYSCAIAGRVVDRGDVYLNRRRAVK